MPFLRQRLLYPVKVQLVGHVPQAQNFGYGDFGGILISGLYVSRGHTMRELLGGRMRTTRCVPFLQQRLDVYLEAHILEVKTSGHAFANFVFRVIIIFDLWKPHGHTMRKLRGWGTGTISCMPFSHQGLVNYLRAHIPKRSTQGVLLQKATLEVALFLDCAFPVDILCGNCWEEVYERLGACPFCSKGL